MKPLLLFVILSFLFTNTFCQSEYGITAATGLSRLTHYRLMPPGKPMPSFSIGGFYQFYVAKKVYFGTQLRVNQLGNRDEIEGVVLRDINGNIYGPSTSYTDYHLTNVALPFYYGLRTKKSSIALGAQMSWLINHLIKTQYESYENGISVEGSYTHDYQIKKLDFGVHSAFSTLLSSRFELEVMFYHGINSIIVGAPLTSIRIQQILLGFRYHLNARDK